MFNVGILASGRSAPLVALYDFQIPVPHNDTNFSVQPGGTVSYYTGSTNMYIPGMWWIGPPSTSIGNSYQLRSTLQAGTAPTQFLGSLGQWQTIGSNRGWYWLAGQSGRVLVEIRDVATQTIRASGRIWRGPYAP